MKILIIGNLGYVGSVLTEFFIHRYHKTIELYGADIGNFAHNYTSKKRIPEINLKAQIFKDVRDLDRDDFINIDAVVYLAAISNDPMGNQFENETKEINEIAAVECATLAKDCGVKSFVFASSCSVYGAGGSNFRTEESFLDPLTAYARSKVDAEKKLQVLATDNFFITSLRFATACGVSPRLRLDLVLNDFVASAILNGRIDILSDGSPWRPLINVIDMSKAIDWAINRCYNSVEKSDQFLSINVGCNEWNYQIKDLAIAVSNVIKGVTVSINSKAEPDKRSYRVNFNEYNRRNPSHSFVDLETTISDLFDYLKEYHFKSEDFRSGELIRLNQMRLIHQGLI